MRYKLTLMEVYMKVLWVVNMVFPEVAELIGKTTSASGGWLLDLSHGVAAYDDIELGIMTYYSGNEFKDITVNGIRHFLFPGGGKRLLFYTKKTELDCKKVVSIFMPDIIHLHGTEYAPALAMTKAVPEVEKLLTIQGIIKRISQEYYGGLTLYEILRFLKVEELLKMKTAIHYKYLFLKNAKREKEILQNVKYVTGRTDWDKSTMLAINSQLTYFRCNYNLREEFYSSEKWNVEKMERHTIMSGAALYPLKGLHILIRALAIVKHHYPDVKLYIPGGNVQDGRIKKPDGYIQYINRLIKNLDLDDNVVFTGKLGPNMVAEYLRKSNVCVVSSAIEGASATLCEAMMIGTPSICAYRGGMTDLLTDGIDGFTYDFPEYPMLAHRIIEIFKNDDLASAFSKRIIKKAQDRHNRTRNSKELVDVYHSILEKGGR